MVSPRGEEEAVSSGACCWPMAGGETVTPMALLVLPFDGTPLWVMVCFLGAIGIMEETFFRKILDRGDLKC